MKRFLLNGFLTLILCVWVTGSVAQAASKGVMIDPFDGAHNYLTDGINGTPWDGFLTSISLLDPMIQSNAGGKGVLRLQSGGGYWSDYGATPLGPMLYKNIKGDFEMTVRVTASAGSMASPVDHNYGGLIARVGDLAVAGAGEDNVAVLHFPRWVGHIGNNTNDNGRAEFGVTCPIWVSGNDPYQFVKDYSWLRLRRVGNTFFTEYGPDGIAWIKLAGSENGIVRDDLNGLSLQIGMCQGSSSGNVGWAEFDNFTLKADAAGTAEGLPVVKEEGQTTDTFTVTLFSAPTADVTVTVDPNSPDITLAGAGANGKATLTFTPANWSVPQTVTVKAVDDAEVEGPDTAFVKFALTSADAAFNGGLILPQMVTVIDNDKPTVILTPTDGNTTVAESGLTDTYTAVLSNAPTATVTVTPFDPSDPNQVNFSPASLTFNAGNWNVPQTVTVSAVDDLLLETNPMFVDIQHIIAAPGSNYDGSTVFDITIKVMDNECGSWGFSPFDFNQDCVVDMLDLAEIITNWLDCSLPDKAGCVDLR